MLLPRMYGICILDLVFLVITMALFQQIVQQKRRTHGVPYPELYAIPGQTLRSNLSWDGSRAGAGDPDEDKIRKIGQPLSMEEADDFNAAQRAYHSTSEMAGPFLALVLIGGIGFPLACGITGAVWVFGRALYALGYISSSPVQRLWGTYCGMVAMIVLLVLNVWYAIIVFYQRGTPVVPP